MFGFMPVPCCRCTSSDDRRDYRALSCGLCNVLAREYGLSTRFLVNRDATFLHMLVAALMPEPLTVAETTCCNPLGPKHPLFQSGPAVEFAAAVTICGVQVKLQDEVTDRNGVGQWGAKALLSANQKRFAKASQALNRIHFPTEDIFRTFANQSTIEASVLNGRQNPAAAAEPTAATFGAIVGHAATLTHTPMSEPLYAMGHALGNLIYWLDAVVDYTDDVRRNHFNPIWAMTRQPILTAATLSESVLPSIEASLQAIQSTVSDLNFHRFQPLVTELLSSGLSQKVNSTITQVTGHNSELEDVTEAREEEEKRCKRNKISRKPNCCVCDCCSCCDCCTTDTSCCCDCDNSDNSCCDCDGCCSCNCGCCCDG